jgi:predicted DNA-binding transcriptional regulator YafY
VIHPYLLEPSGIGFTTYVIGHVDPPGALRTFKLERIQEASLTDQLFTIPTDFSGLDVLQSAWSIIYGEALIEIVLRFHPSVVDRVLETQWHTSQHTQRDPEKPGYLIWSVQVADTVDIMPWIRGWGADVEVLAPEELRQEVAGEAARLARIYGADQNREQDEGYQRLFGE